MTRRILIVLLLSLAAVTPLAGCGAEDVASDVTSEDVARAAEATIDAGGARLDLNGTTNVHGKATIDLEGKGVMDARGNAEIDFDFSGAGEKGSLHQVIAGETIYMSSSLFEDLPDGKEWIKVDLAKVTDDLGLENVPQTSGSDPRESLRNLRAVGDVEKVATDDVRGVSTTRYKATVELRRLPQLVEPAERATARRSVQRLIRLLGKDTQQTEVWVDGKDLVRRTRDEVTVSAPGNQKVTTTMILEYYDFGARVRVEVPADREVEDVSRVAAREARKQQRD